MIHIMTPQLRQALTAEPGQPVKLIDDETQRVYYVISAEQFESLQARLADGEFVPSELYPLITRTAAAAGWSEPVMDAYDNYDAHGR